MIKEVLKDAENHMKKTVEVFRHEIATLRTGKASVSLLDGVQVEYYGTKMPLNQIATVSAPDATLIVVTPYDMTALQAIEKAIREADLGLNPSNDGKKIMVPVPPLTEERRKTLVKKLHEYAEQCRVAVRNIRRDARDKVKKMLKDKEISEDDERRAEDEIQKLTDKYIDEIDDIADKKEKDIMHV